MNQTCKVCGEPAAGFHFGAFTCEGCKSFFGRSYNNLSSINECKNNGKCVIDKKNRTTCKACRLRKCYTVGMSKGGSRYGRRSNWFKIHCLLQEQQQKAVEEAGKAAAAAAASGNAPPAAYGDMATAAVHQRNSHLSAVHHMGLLSYPGYLNTELLQSHGPFGMPVSGSVGRLPSDPASAAAALPLFSMMHSMPSIGSAQSAFQLPAQLLFPTYHPSAAAVAAADAAYHTEMFKHRQSVDSAHSSDSQHYSSGSERPPYAGSVPKSPDLCVSCDEPAASHHSQQHSQHQHQHHQHQHQYHHEHQQQHHNQHEHQHGQHKQDQQHENRDGRSSAASSFVSSISPPLTNASGSSGTASQHQHQHQHQHQQQQQATAIHSPLASLHATPKLASRTPPMVAGTQTPAASDSSLYSPASHHELQQPFASKLQSLSPLSIASTVSLTSACPSARSAGSPLSNAAAPKAANSANGSALATPAAGDLEQDAPIDLSMKATRHKTPPTAADEEAHSDITDAPSHTRKFYCISSEYDSDAVASDADADADADVEGEGDGEADVSADEPLAIKRPKIDHDATSDSASQGYQMPQTFGHAATSLRGIFVCV